MATAQSRLFLISLLESEKIVPHGVSRQTWSVHYDGRWLPARRAPGAVVIFLSSSRGTVWERRVELKLRAGTKLELSSEVPRPRRAVDAFSVMTVDQARQHLIRRIPHQVGNDGQLVRVVP